MDNLDVGFDFFKRRQREGSHPVCRVSSRLLDNSKYFVSDGRIVSPGSSVAIHEEVVAYLYSLYAVLYRPGIYFDYLINHFLLFAFYKLIIDMICSFFLSGFFQSHTTLFYKVI